MNQLEVDSVDWITHNSLQKWWEKQRCIFKSRADSFKTLNGFFSHYDLKLVNGMSIT